MLHKVLLCVGTNTDHDHHIKQAREVLSLLLSDVRFTKVQRSAPYGVKPDEADPDMYYYNILCEGYTPLTLNAFQTAIKVSEEAFGRVRPSSLVPIDIDLMRYDDQRFHLKDWERPYFKQLLQEL